MWAIHLKGAMVAPRTIPPFKLAASDESLSSQSGLALDGELGIHFTSVFWMKNPYR
jgi:hypothetical protein